MSNIMSDLHLETPRCRPLYNSFTVTPRSRFLALLGDIGSVHDARLFSFLESQLQKFEIVFYVLGNHEPYRRESLFQEDEDPGVAYTLEAAVKIIENFEAANADTLASLANEGEAAGQQKAAKLGRFVFLNRRRYDISETVTILGATLFSHIADEQRQTTSLFVSDFSNIQDWTVDAHNSAHAGDLAWLNREVEAIKRESEVGEQQPVGIGSGSRSSRARSVVILTHYSPTCLPQANDPEHLEDERGVQSAFATDLSGEPCWTAPCVKVWAFGHTHFNCDFVDERGKRVVANQRGYGREDAFDFDGEKVVGVV
ncbi:hypothetical protein ACHAQA_007442 [Verticillium albo-atrum]